MHHIIKATFAVIVSLAALLMISQMENHCDPFINNYYFTLQISSLIILGCSIVSSYIQ